MVRNKKPSKAKKEEKQNPREVKRLKTAESKWSLVNILARLWGQPKSKGKSKPVNPSRKVAIILRALEIGLRTGVLNKVGRNCYKLADIKRIRSMPSFATNGDSCSNAAEDTVSEMSSNDSTTPESSLELLERELQCAASDSD